MNLKQIFLSLFLMVNFQNNLFCSSEFEKFQNKCGMPISFIAVGGILLGITIPPLINSFSDFRNPNSKGPYAWGSKNKNLISCSLSTIFSGLFVLYGMALLSGVHNEYTDKINA